MAQIGCLGDIAFVVSANKVETIDNVVWSGSARYSEHSRHLINALTEFTGIDADRISFDILLSEYLGVDPMAELVKIWQYEREGKTLPLVIGSKAYGKYRWTIVEHSIKMKTFDRHGSVNGAAVSIKLLEYLKR